MTSGSGTFLKGRHMLRFAPQSNRYTDQLAEWARVIRAESEPTYTFGHDFLVHEVTLATAGYIPRQSSEKQ